MQTGRFLKLEENTKGSDYLCPDIHGMFHLLENQLKELKFDESKDRLIVVGDLVDRGEYSERCVEFLKKPWFFSVYGNHEDLAYHTVTGDSLDSPYARCWFSNGGDWFMKNEIYCNQEFQKDFLEAIRNLPYAIEIQVGDKRVGIVHAEVPQDVTWDTVVQMLSKLEPDFIPPEDDSDIADLLQALIWGRTKIRLASVFMGYDFHTVKGIDHLFVGHTPLDTQLTLGNATYTDLGSCFTNQPLNIININEFLKQLETVGVE